MITPDRLLKDFFIRHSAPELELLKLRKSGFHFCGFGDHFRDPDGDLGPHLGPFVPIFRHRRVFIKRGGGYFGTQANTSPKTANLRRVCRA